MASQKLVLLESETPRAQRKKPVREEYDEKPEGANSHNPMAEARARSRNIALVEDQQELLSTYASIFNNLGWNTVFAGTKGEDILEAAKTSLKDTDVVIMDFRLPGIDGLETAKRLSSLIPNAKIVITTADDALRKPALAAGFHFLQKPFSMLDLIEYLSGL